MDQWVRTDRGRRPPRTDEVARSSRPAASAPVLPADVAAGIRRAADTATGRHKEVLVARMESAVAAYERGRYQEAMRLGKQLAAEVGSVAAVRRLAGFAAYRLGSWREAVRQLEAYEEMTDDPDAVPALMDCLRALGRHRAVAGRWTRLRQRSPDADVLAEARMVAAGSLADRGDLRAAIELLSSAGAGRGLRNPSERHLRQWYALGDLYERAGDVPRARELFVRVAKVDPEAYDVSDRLEALGPERRRNRRPRPAGGPAIRPADERAGAPEPPEHGTRRVALRGRAEPAQR
jgi:tetratricopeptide (TPR) repeat protein